MQAVLYIESVDQANALLKPRRIEILKRLAEPHTCPELAAAFHESAQNIYYHVKTLERAGLVIKVGERRVRGTVEGRYQASARAYWLAPQLVGHIGGSRAAKDQTSLRYLLALAEAIQAEVGHLAQQVEAGQSVASLSLSANLYLPDPARRADLLRDVQQTFERLAREYSRPADEAAGAPDSGQDFRLALACYPHQPD
jgi:DNA-binding transcriptional ArsR family regulator